MSNDKYEPSPLADVSTRVAADADGVAERWTLVFVRELRHAPETVWSALTDPAQLKQWAPFDADRNLGSAGSARLTMAGGPPDETEEMPIEVRTAERPRLLEYTWGGDLLRWELQPTAQGTRLTLHHTVEDKSWLSKVCAGWHICLDVAERMLQGRPIGRIAAEEARKHGWDELENAYAKKLGSEDA